MTVPTERRPIRTGFRLAIDAPPSAPPWSTQTSIPASIENPVEGLRESTTVRVQRAWSTMGVGDGGALLDEALTALGQSYADGNRVIWLPPPDLDPAYVDYLSASVERLNDLIAGEVVEVADDGSIRPVQTPNQNRE